MDFHFCRHSKSGFFEVEFLLVLCFKFCRLLLAEDPKKREREIHHENYDQFASRLIQTIKSFPKEIIEKTISSVPFRIEMILKSKGEKTKY